MWGTGEGLVGVVEFSVVWISWEAEEYGGMVGSGAIGSLPDRDRCTISGGGREDRIYSPYFGSEGLEGFCKRINVPRRMVGAILAQILWGSLGEGRNI